MALIDIDLNNIKNFNYKKVGGVNSGENGTFEINQGLNTNKNTAYNSNDIENQYKKLKPDEDQAIVRGIGKRYRGTNADGGLVRGGGLLYVERTAEDLRRISKTLFSNKGLKFTLKQSILQSQNAREDTRIYNPLFVLRNIGEGLIPDGGPSEAQGSPRHSIQTTYEQRAYDQYKKDTGEEFTIQRQSAVKLTDKRIRQDIQEVDENGKPTGKTKKRANALNIKYGGNFGYISKFDKTGKDLPTDFIKFRIRDAVNGKYIIFPALISGISDNSSATYAPSNYIGRPESVYVYQSRTRSISFNLKVVAFNDEDLEINWVKINALKGLTQPEYKPFFNVTDSDTEKETRPVAPYIYLTIGDMFVNTPGFFESVNVTIPDTTSWEIIDGKQFPHMCDIALSFTYIGKEVPTMRGVNYDGIKAVGSGDDRTFEFRK